MATSLPLLLGAPPVNNCGGCTACCDVIGVRALGKPYYARCKHVGDAGCNIYDTRPHGCQIYRCAWHIGLFGDRVDRRPDQCGVLFQIEPDGSECYLELYELSPGAANTERARYLKDLILNNKRFRRLPLAKCYVRTFPFGSDIPVEFPIAEEFRTPVDESAPEGKIRVDPHSPSEGRFEGRQRELLRPALFP